MEREVAGDVSPIYAMPGHLARRLHQIAVSFFMEETRAIGITPVQFAALSMVQDRPGIDQRSLARAIALDRSTTADVVVRLERKGYFRRAGGAEDKRTKQIFLTQEGQDVLARLQDPVRRSQDQLLAALSEGEQKIFMFLLDRLVRLNNEMSRAPLQETAELD